MIILAILDHLPSLLSAENCDMLSRIAIKYLCGFHDSTVIALELSKEGTNCALAQILVETESVAMLHYPIQQVFIWAAIESNH